MNDRDRIAAQSDDDGPVLSSFVSEASLPASLESNDPADVLCEFPEERSLSIAPVQANPARAKKKNDAAAWTPPALAPLAAAMFAAVIAGAWWGGLIPRDRPLVINAPLPAIAKASAVKPTADASSDPPAQLVASMEVRPSTWPPVANIVPTVAYDDTTSTPKPVALSGAEPQRRQPPERALSMARGTSGAAMAPNLGSRPSPEPLPTPPMVVANSAVRSAVPAELPPAIETPPATPPPPSRMTAPLMRPEPEALPSVVARTEQSEIQRTLGQYRTAYQTLDAEAARAVWPSVDVRALARAFDSLTSQQLAFETCQFEIAGEAATAQCRGSATYIPKVGSRGPKLEPRQWTFQLRKVDEGWKIQSAQTRR